MIKRSLHLEGKVAAKQTDEVSHKRLCDRKIKLHLIEYLRKIWYIKIKKA
ncbi:MAG: hypothetical protein IJF26_00375 [Clostridia bacterium]|nr:hypothetical protein [Clostridia bacterium]